MTTPTNRLLPSTVRPGSTRKWRAHGQGEARIRIYGSVKAARDRQQRRPGGASERYRSRVDHRGGAPGGPERRVEQPSEAIRSGDRRREQTRESDDIERRVGKFVTCWSAAPRWDSAHALSG